MLKVKNSVVDSGEVAGATGLVLFGFKCEGVNVGDTVISACGFSGTFSTNNSSAFYITSTFVVLVSLNFSEIFTLSTFEAVMSVKLKKSCVAGNISVIWNFRTAASLTAIAIMIDISRMIMYGPYKFFYRMVEAEFVLSAGSADGKSVGVLNLFDEVFV